MLQALASHVRQVRDPDWADLRIEDLWLDNLFLSVRLNDGSVGVALNYDQEGHHGVPREVSRATRAHLLELAQTQPLLWEVATEPTASLAQMALLVALLSALSAPVLADPTRLAALGLTSAEGRLPLARGTVTVIGAGGYLGDALQSSAVQAVHCVDLNCADEEFCRKIRQRYPQPHLHLDDGRNTRDLVERADVVSITASTLCNGSLESLLPRERGKTVILEGPSGGVLPGPLFDRGVTHLVHNPVDVDYVHLSQRFSRQEEKGLAGVRSGRFIDLLLPEQRTVYPL